MWKYLSGHYHVTGDYDCDTHIRVSMSPDFNLQEVKRIAQAVIHLEPAYDALLPSRNGHVTARSNWLHGTSFAPSELTRSRSIDFIEDNASMAPIDLLMHRVGVEDDDEFSWNFSGLKNEPREIVFRKPPYSTTSRHCLSWAEFTMAFVLAGIRYQSTELLQRIPSNVRGLRWFLSRYNVQGLIDSSLVGSIWRGISLDAMLDPRICLADESCPEDEVPEEMEHCDDMIRADRTLREDFARNSREPYY
jgi:hypothetical protein